MTVSTSAGSLINESLGRFDHCRVAPQGLDKRFHLVKPIQELGVLFCETEELTTLRRLFFLDFADGTGLDSLVAPHAEIFRSGRFLLTPGALDARNRVGFLLGDVEAVGLCKLSVAGVIKDRDVSSGGLASTSPAVMILKRRLVHPTASEERGRRLSEVGECNGFIDAGMVGGLPRNFSGHLIGDLLAATEFAPEGRGTLVTPRVVVEPPVQVRNCRDQCDRSLTLLAVDRNLQAVTMIRDVPYAKIEEFAGAGAGVKRDSDKGGVPGVHRRLDHRFHVLLPIEHLGRIGFRIVVAARRCWYPTEAFGDTVVVGRDVDAVLDDTFTKHPEGDPVVLVRLRGFLGVVGGVNPPNDTFRFATVLECGGQVVVVSFGYLSTMSEQFFPALFSIYGGEEFHAAVEGEKQVSVGLGDLSFAGFNLFTKSIELPLWMSHHLQIQYYSKGRELNLGYISRLGRCIASVDFW